MYATGGVVRSTVQLRAAGVGSVRPSARARTYTVCEPPDRPVYDLGDEQADHAPSSSRHSKVAWLSEEPNSNVALRARVTAGGPLLNDSSGGRLRSTETLPCTSWPGAPEAFGELPVTMWKSRLRGSRRLRPNVSGRRSRT